MAKMGLSVKDDPRKTVNIAGRSWGESVSGVALSVVLPREEDPDELPAISIGDLQPAHLDSAEIIHERMAGFLPACL